jgi:hypothetical protein
VAASLTNSLNVLQIEQGRFAQQEWKLTLKPLEDLQRVRVSYPDS